MAAINIEKVGCLCCGYIRIFLRNVSVDDITSIVVKYFQSYDYRSKDIISTNNCSHIKLGWDVISRDKVAIKIMLTLEKIDKKAVLSFTFVLIFNLIQKSDDPNCNTTIVTFFFV